MDLLYTLLAKSPYFRTSTKFDKYPTINSFGDIIRSSGAEFTAQSRNPIQLNGTHGATRPPFTNVEEVLLKLFRSWHTANFDTSFQMVEELAALLARAEDNAALSLPSIIEGALWSSAGLHSEAKRIFFRLSESSSLEDDYTQAILSHQVAWLYIQDYKLDVAKELLVDLPQYIDPVVKAHFAMLRAIISYLEADEAGAEELFAQAYDYFKKENNHVALSTVKLYLSLLYMDSGDEKRHYAYLCDGLRELEKNGLTYITYSWHSLLGKRILGKAIELECNADYAQQIINHHQSAQKMKIARHRAPRQQSSTVQKSKIKRPETERTKQHQKAEKALKQLLMNEVLDTRTLPALAEKIPHGIHRDRINPTIISVYGLHVQNFSNKEIAHTLLIAESTVSAYITKIYKAFVLTYSDFPNSSVRRSHLVEQGREEGYILNLPPNSR